MKKTISTYWPVAILLPVALAFCMQAGEQGAAAARHENVGVATVSAELARAISLGLVDADDSASKTTAGSDTL